MFTMCKGPCLATNAKIVRQSGDCVLSQHAAQPFIKSRGNVRVSQSNSHCGLSVHESYLARQPSRTILSYLRRVEREGIFVSL